MGRDAVLRLAKLSVHRMCVVSGGQGPWEQQLSLFATNI